MATARGMVRSHATPLGGPAELMTNVNAHLCDDVPTGQFMTLMYAVVDRPRKQLRLVAAGHDPILAYSPRSDEFRELGGTDLPLGIQRDWVFHEHIYPFDDDSILILGTDGIWETFSPEGEQFGIERLKECIRANAQKNARGIKQGILDAVSEFRGSGPQQDDVTVVVIRIMPADVAEARIEVGPAITEADQIATARR
jgi:sigma-B regulation protein RsbU (phosphoserine phosphatase)